MKQREAEDFEVVASGHLDDMNEEDYNVFLKPYLDPVQRLEQLRADFEQAHAAYASTFPGDDGESYCDPAYVASWKTEQYEVNPCPRELKMIAAARRYIIARDYGVFDPDRADMLFKLQNGGEQ